MGTETDKFIHSVRRALSSYGRDYALGAVRGLAVRNMISVSLPDPGEGFYPIVKVHEMALRELEDIFYSQVQSEDSVVHKKELILELVDKMVWE